MTTHPDRHSTHRPMGPRKALSASETARRLQMAWPVNPVEWHRTLCPIGDGIYLSGDLGDTTHEMRYRLEEWKAAGITDIIDVRIEADDSSFVARHAPEIEYHWLGVDDDGGRQPDEWFERGVAAGREALRDPQRRVVIHCHMGVNRGPSMGYALKLALGIDPIAGLEQIRAGRPIAAILYAEDALDWWGRHQGIDVPMAELHDWFESNPVDVSWIISRIAQRRIA